jgi:hypothetical protein
MLKFNKKETTAKFFCGMTASVLHITVRFFKDPEFPSLPDAENILVEQHTGLI